MRMNDAREILIEALVNNFVDNIDHHNSNYIARHGHLGFAKMDNVALVSCIVEAGLHESNDEVNEATETIERQNEIDMLGPQDQHDDSPHLESGRDNCDDWGTGEGAYHGRI